MTIPARIKRISRNRTVLGAGLITGDPLTMRRWRTPRGSYKIRGEHRVLPSKTDTPLRFHIYIYSSRKYPAICLLLTDFDPATKL